MPTTTCKLKDIIIEKKELGDMKNFDKQKVSEPSEMSNWELENCFRRNERAHAHLSEIIKSGEVTRYMKKNKKIAILQKKGN